MSHTINISASEFEAKVLKSATPVLVDFWAEWCGPCKLMEPVLDTISHNLAGTLTIAKIEVDDPDNRKLAAQYEVRGIPNMKLFKSGKVVAEFIGLMDQAELEKSIQTYLV